MSRNRSAAAEGPCFDAEGGVKADDVVAEMRDALLVAEPRTRYARGDDASIAYQVLGAGPLDLVIVPGFVSHLEIQWQLLPHRRFVERLAENLRVIRYDKRGTGLSDPVASAPTLEQRVADLRAVLDAVDCRRAVLLGYSDGGPTAIAFAVVAPERTARLILYGTSARPPPLWCARSGGPGRCRR